MGRTRKLEKYKCTIRNGRFLSGSVNEIAVGDRIG